MADLDRRRTLGLLLIVLALASGLRLAGIGWGGNNLLHPDERFLAMVVTSLEPNEHWLDYFDTSSSTLNPENVGSRPNFVYGTYPLILVRLLGEATGLTGLVELTLVGRIVSMGWDLLTMVVLCLLGARLADRRTGLLAAFFLAVTVLHIQQSHFFTVDLAQTFFVTLSLLLAVRIAEPATDDAPPPPGVRARLRSARLGLSLAFGAAAAAAVAAKLSAAPVVLLLPAAHLLRELGRDRDRRTDAVLPVLVVLAAAALVFGLGFRVLQPYAFAGPGLLDLGLNPRWANAIDGLRSLTSPDADWPPAMQWARRSALYSGRNMVLWGFGLPLGALAFAGAVAGARVAARRRHGPLALVVGWALGYFAWQSLASNPTMRYQLPVYPAFALLAAWAVTALWRHGAGEDGRPVWRRAAVVAAVAVGTASLLYALAFTGIYLRPITREAASRWLLAEVPGPVNLILGSTRQPVAIPYDPRLEPGGSLETRTRATVDGTVSRLTVPRLVAGAAGDEPSADPSPPGLRATLTIENRDLEAIGAARCRTTGEAGVFECDIALEPPVAVTASDQLRITLELLGGGDRWVRPEGGAIANETGWDDGLPLRLDGYDPFGGIYQRDLSLELYWNDDQAKREHMIEVLDRADVLVLSSNRQWGSLPRIPERFPLVTEYYRHLIGCPPERSVVHCFIGAEAGDAAGDLGFELAAVFASPPRLGPVELNDQWADEAFTVYDHPKVMIFRKAADYDPARVRAILGAVDLDHTVNRPPGRFGRQPADLMLPAERFERQRAGGTWRDRFPPDGPLNRHPWLAALAWYLALAVLGLGAAPLVRWAMPGLADGGLPLARGFGLLLLAWLVWMAGSAGLTVSQWTVRLVAAALVAAGAAVAWRQRAAHASEGAELARRLLTSELVFAVFFAVALAIRCTNPDLWHAAHGGEKPMDLSYFTAVLKSVGFPPYDPWFAGGYINYYYFGFVIVGQLALALGIRPEVAYNLAMATLIALAAAAAFSIASNVVASGGEPPGSGERRRLRPAVAGWLAAASVTLLGNLHPVRMLVGGLAELGAGAGRGAVTAVAAGLSRLVAGQHLPIPSHHWFWNPTRIIPDPDVMPITEFPAFTLVYGDLHAHLMDLPQVLLAMAFALAVMVGWRHPVDRSRRLAAVFFGALAVGAMRPTNTWSYYPFLALGCLAVAVARQRLEARPGERAGPARPLLWMAGFAVLTRVLYLPFDAWFGMGYSELVYWSRSRTPIPIYLEHWAPFLFPVATWLVLEVLDWLAATPLAAIRPMKRHTGTLLLIGAPAIAGQLGLAVLGVRIAWLVWPMLVMTGVLLLRRDLAPARRFALLAAGLALSLTVVVELVTLKFDLGRMNTVFKFYYVAWALLGVVAAASLWWRAARRFRAPAWVAALWWLTAGSLLAGATLYPLRAVPARAADRMAAAAPRGLDGLAYLEVAVHHDQGESLVLAEDLAVIRWLRRHVDGTPVIVEANVPEYRWGSRITVNTGLPAVVGWNWHQRQQRAVAGDARVWERVRAVTDFYTGSDRDAAAAFLDRYQVDWIVVGGLERAYYPPEGLAKFQAWEGDLWREAFRTGETVVYQVLR